MTKLPPDSGWLQANSSDKQGSIFYSKNINLDEKGYIKLSPRSVLVMSEADDANHGLPVAFGVHNVSNEDASNALVVTTDQPYEFNPSNITVGYTEDTGSGNPTLSIDSHAVFFHDLWVATTDTAAKTRTTSSSAWSTATNVSLTTGKTHFACVFKSRNTICFADGNTVDQYTESGGTFTASTVLTIPSEFEVTKLAYNNEKMAVVARLSANSASGVSDDTYFFVWDGSTTSAGQGVAVGSSGVLNLFPYKGSFLIVTESGQLKFWTGGGFQTLGNLPLYTSAARISRDILNYGDTSKADGDVVYFHIGNAVYIGNRKQETMLYNFPAGVWCFDQEAGFYHRYSPSISQAYVVSVAAAGVNTTTNVITAATGTIPATGNIARYTSINGSTAIGGLTIFSDYYIIKVSSSTFKLATSKADALAGTALDLTAQSGDTNYFWMYNLVDYGQTNYDGLGAIQLLPQLTRVYESLVIGAQLVHTNLTEYADACLTVPFLENRGYFVTPTVFSSQVTDNNQKLFVKFRPLKTTDSIIVKYRDRDVVGLPVTSSGDEAIWTSPSEFYTVQDLSEAKTYLDAGGELECEFVSGAGGGVMVKVTSISTDNTTYSVVLAEEVLGATSTLKSEFIIHNWKVLRTITSTDSDHDSGVTLIPIGGSSKFSQFKVEMRGSDVTIEELGFINNTSKKAE